MTINRRAARRDDNEPGIIDGLEKIGCQVYQLSEPCDILILYQGRHYVQEISNPANKYRKREKKQLDTLERMNIPIVQSLFESMLHIGCKVIT